MNSFIKKFKIKRRAISLLMKLHFFGNPSKKLKIIGITGTNGKTTTATLLYKVATALGYKVGLIGTVENLIAREKKLLPKNGPSTSPDLIFLNKLLKEMVEKGCQFVFMEVSSHALDQDRVAGISFTGGVFTNITHEHLDYHRNFENYFLAKKKFFKMLSKDAFALSNTDDEHGLSILLGIKAKKFSYGFKGGPSYAKASADKEDFHGEIAKINFSGLKLIFNEKQVTSKLLGKFNAYNLLSVWSTAKILNFDMEKVGKILENIESPSGRFQYFKSPNGIYIIVDYAHTPDALENVLLAVKEIKTEKGRVISVFGCGGDRDSLKRPVMGKIGATLSDIAIFTSDNPRSEDPEKIIEEMKNNLSPDLLQKVQAITNRHEAILKAVKEAKEGDIIICAGKGHEDYQEIKGVKHHFDDMEELKKAFS